ncbi:MAG: methyltransferase domain-containing protein [Pseudomonadota bacterium]
MRLTVSDLKTFYSEVRGRVVRNIIRTHIRALWPDCEGLRMMGFGYASTYLKPYKDEAERMVAVMPRAMGVHYWPRGEKNLACLSEENDLPFETNSIDRIIVIHSLEVCDNIDETYAELWRVLKSTGRMIVIVPNRLGFWTRADWTPFGHGTPYSATQVRRLLTDHQFVHERTRKILYVPPFRSQLFIRSAQFFEAMGQYICSALCGLHMIEVSKQIYAEKGQGLKQKAKIPIPKILPEPAVNRNKMTKE